MAKTASAFGRNITLSLDTLRVAVIEKVQKDAEKNGLPLPPMHELAVHAQIHYLDEANQPVKFDRVIITFEE